MSITAVVENGMIKLPTAVPDGTQVEIILPATERDPASPSQGEPLSWMVEFAGCLDTLPADAAERRAEYASGRGGRLPGQLAAESNPEAIGAARREVAPAFAWMLEFAGSIDSLPEDFGQKHDDYLSGRKGR